MAEICVQSDRCDICPLDKIAVGDQFPVYIDKLPDSSGAEMPLPPNEVGVSITGDDVVLGLERRMKLKTETGKAIADMRISGLCSKVSAV